VLNERCSRRRKYRCDLCREQRWGKAKEKLIQSYSQKGQHLVGAENRRLREQRKVFKAIKIFPCLKIT
jgi:hypothetical protein